MMYDVTIVGGGIAGHSAALTAKSLRLNYLWLAPLGGKEGRAEYVRNYPAFTGSGSELSEALKKQAEKEGLTSLARRVDGIYKNKEGFILTTGQESFSSRTVILATGVEPQGTLPGEKEFLGRGVSYCAVCDGALYRNKPVVAVLSRKEFEEEAEYLAGFASTLTCVCRYPSPTLAGTNIRLVFDVPLAIEGELRARTLRCKKNTLEADGFFFLRNSAPPEALVHGLKTAGEHVLVDRSMATNVAGLFAAGDLTGTPYQFAKAAGEGLVAAYSVRAYLKEQA